MKMLRFLSTGFITGIAIATIVVLCSPAEAASRNKSGELQITRDATGKVVVSWTGKGVLKQATALNGRFKPVRNRGKLHTTAATEQQMVYALSESAQSPIYSVNMVGYVNTQLPPGLSLICNPLLNTDNTVEGLFRQWDRNMPDGTQVYKYVPGVGYEVSIFDGDFWSNPDMDLSPGIGFFVDNPSSSTIVNTFVGEVLLGTLINNLPVGFSLEGPLIPQAGSINDLQGIPGEPGDIIRFYVNDGQGGGDYVTSVFSGVESRWVPDLVLGVGKGFVSEKQNAQDWIREFWPFP
jgi:hypothetical protein